MSGRRQPTGRRVTALVNVYLFTRCLFIYCAFLGNANVHIEHKTSQRRRASSVEMTENKLAKFDSWCACARGSLQYVCFYLTHVHIYIDTYRCMRTRHVDRGGSLIYQAALFTYSIYCTYKIGTLQKVTSRLVLFIRDVESARGNLYRRGRQGAAPAARRGGGGQ